jgi:type II secretory pathway component GspD/PulD (secretin)
MAAAVGYPLGMLGHHLLYADDSSATSSPAQNVDSQALLAQGLDQYNKGQFDEAQTTLSQVTATKLSDDDRQKLIAALADLQEKVAARQQARTEFNLGEVARKANHPIEAIAHYQAVLNNSAADEGTRSKAQEQLALAEAEAQKAAGGDGALYTQAQQDFDAGKLDQARTEFQSLVDTGYHAPLFHKSPADYVASIDQQKAAAIASAAPNPQHDAAAAYNQAVAQYRSGDLGNARANFTKAEQLGYQPGFMQKSPSDYLANMDAKAKADAEAQAAANAAANQQAQQVDYQKRLAEVRAIYARGVQEYQAGDWNAARKDFAVCARANYAPAGLQTKPTDYLANIDAGEKQYMDRQGAQAASASYDKGKQEFASGQYAAASMDFRSAQAAGFTPGLFQTSPADYLNQIQQKQQDASTGQVQTASAEKATPVIASGAATAAASNVNAGNVAVADDMTPATAPSADAAPATMPAEAPAAAPTTEAIQVPDTGTPATAPAAAAPAPAAAAPAGEMSPQQLLDQTASNQALATQQNQYKARGLVDMAKTAYDENRKEEALRLYTQATELDPTNSDAIAGRDQVAMELGRGTGPAGGGMNQIQQRIQEEIGAITYKFNTAIADAKTAIAANDFDRATGDLQTARVARSSDPGIFPAATLEDFDNQIAATQASLDQARVAYTQSQSAAALSEAQQQQQALALQQQSQRQALIAGLVKTAREDVDSGHYEEALGVIDQIIVLDPRNDYATGVRQLVEDKAILQQQRGYREQFNQMYERQLNASEEMKIPYDEILRYPTNWPDISEMRDEEVQSEQGVSKTDQAVEALLDKHLPEVHFDGVGFTDVVDFLRDITGANIFVNWRALEQAGVDKNSPVTARLRDVKFSKALDIVLSEVGGGQVKLSYTVDEGVITISTADDLSKNVSTRVYDIRDLIVDIPDFTNAPNFNLQTSNSSSNQTIGAGSTSNTTSSNGGGNLFGGGGGGGGQTTETTRKDLVDQIIKLIESTVAPDTWRDSGGSVGAISELSGQLIVTQTPENQLALMALLNQLRETRAIQVTIETRFLTVQRNFLEDIGLDFNFAFNLNNPNHWSPITVSNQTSAFTASPETSAPGTLAGEAQGLSIGATFLDNFEASFLLQATQATVDSTLVTAPRVTLFNGQRAFVLVSTEQAYVSDLTPVVANNVVGYQATIGQVDSGVLLDVAATVSADRKYVTLTLRPQLSTLLALVPFSITEPASAVAGATGNAGTGNVSVGSNNVTATIQEPEIQLTEVQTSVSVPDGGTLLIGGQTIAGEVEREAGVPILSKIPFLKRLFTNTSTAKDEQVLLILVKPTIIIEREVENKAFPLLSTKINS